jgi:hypothetical protein
MLRFLSPLITRNDGISLPLLSAENRVILWGQRAGMPDEGRGAGATRPVPRKMARFSGSRRPLNWGKAFAALFAVKEPRARSTINLRSTGRLCA